MVNAGPVAPVAPVAPVSPVAPVAPVGPVSPVAPVAPVAPVTPTPVAPVAPVMAPVLLDETDRMLSSLDCKSISFFATSCKVWRTLAFTRRRSLTEAGTVKPGSVPMAYCIFSASA
ncbi:hypothetical protein B5G50_18540 [Brevibacillus brevis]|nr:hypothetical protein B5G50_18540 [Brevibacillus brevis]